MPGMVIIGAGECGVRAAFTLRERGYTGSVTLIGDEAGTPYERPPLSKDAQQPRKPIRSDEAFVEAGIDYRHGTSATRLDPASKTVLLFDGTSIAYDKLLLATGAKARLFPGMDGCLT
jgi:3-phenylpropionate/trans-cinnamate dioxygenase ferredoxin reductase component